MKSKFNIVEISDIEPYRSRLVNFWQRFLINTHSDSRVDWLYSLNPIGPTYTWLAFLEGSDEIIGCGSLYQSKYYFNGNPIRVAVAIDFGVDDRFRVFGPSVGIQREIVSAINERGFELAFVYPNKESTKVFQRVGFSYVGQCNGFSLVLKSKKWLQEYTRSRMISNILSPLVDVIMSLIHLFSYRFDYSGYYYKVYDKCSFEFDDLWNREKNNYMLLPEKTAKYLNWYYSGSTVRKYRYHCLFDKISNKLYGYIMYSTEEDYVAIHDIFPSDSKKARLLIW